MGELKLLGMLSRRRSSDVAVALRVTDDEFEIALGKLGIKQMPPPAPIPDHATWLPENDISYPAIRALGHDHEAACETIENAVRWALREGVMYIDVKGELVREFDPVLLEQPTEWSPA